MSSQAVVVDRRGRGSLSYPVRVVFEVLTLLALIAPIFWLQAHWREFPLLIPEHFDANGVADRTGLKSHLWFAPFGAALLYLGGLIASFFAHVFDLPVGRGDARRSRMEHLAVEVVLTVRLELVAILGILTIARGLTALNGKPTFGVWFHVGAPLIVLLTLAAFAWEMLRVRRAR